MPSDNRPQFRRRFRCRSAIWVGREILCGFGEECGLEVEEVVLGGHHEKEKGQQVSEVLEGLDDAPEAADVGDDPEAHRSQVKCGSQTRIKKPLGVDVGLVDAPPLAALVVEEPLHNSSLSR